MNAEEEAETARLVVTRPADETRGTVIFPFQVSGHDLMLRTRRGQIIKVASEREIRFYERVRDCSPGLLPFVPRYYGRLHVASAARHGAPSDLRALAQRKLASLDLARANLSPWTQQVAKKDVKRLKPNSAHIMISDLTRHYHRPHIVDIKLGTLHHSQAREVQKPTKYQTAVSLGYCLGGMMTWNEKHGRYQHMDKYVGRTLTEDTIGGVLELFFAPNGVVCFAAIEQCVLKLRKLLAHFDQQTTWRFHSTSLLVIYEYADGESGARGGKRRQSAATGAGGGNADGGSGDAPAARAARAHSTASEHVLTRGHVVRDERGEAVRVSLALVDFAHAYMNHAGVEGRQPQLDEGCRLGVRNVIAVLDNMLRSKSPRVARWRDRLQWSSTVKWTDDDDAEETTVSFESEQSAASDSPTASPVPSRALAPSLDPADESDVRSGAHSAQRCGPRLTTAQVNELTTVDDALAPKDEDSSDIAQTGEELRSGMMRSASPHPPSTAGAGKSDKRSRARTARATRTRNNRPNRANSAAAAYLSADEDE